jgi:hypothetical protein
MVRKGTWILLLTLLALVGLSLFLQKRQSGEAAAPTATSSILPLFSEASGEPARIRIENAAGDTVEFARSADGTWALIAPSQTEADQASAEAAATQISALRSLSVVRLAPAVVGLDKPEYTLVVTFGDGTVHTLLVGSPTPIQDGYYAQLDEGAFQVVDKYGLDALIGLLMAPPYAATPTPRASATPAATATSALEVSTATETSATPSGSP